MGSLRSAQGLDDNRKNTTKPNYQGICCRPYLFPIPKINNALAVQFIQTRIAVLKAYSRLDMLSTVTSLVPFRSKTGQRSIAHLLVINKNEQGGNVRRLSEVSNQVIPLKTK